MDRYSTRRGFRENARLDFYRSVLEVLDLGSFSSIWYWIGLAVMWSVASHFTLGVPYDIVRRSRSDPQAADDMADLVRIAARRLTVFDDRAALAAVGALAAMLTMLALIGFGYGGEMAQALFFMFFPMSIVTLLSVRRARRIMALGAVGETLRHQLMVHRRQIQLIGMLSLFVTAVYGMFYNFAVGPFG